MLKFYDITNPNIPDNSKQKIYLLSGEHPRELIAVETVFSFIKFLCFNKDDKSMDLLSRNVIRVVLNANTTQRRLVENGNFCIRVNPNNVDINRNWDYYWGREVQLSEESPGAKPFSEVETNFIKETVRLFQPKLFLTIHSGMYGLFHPFAYYEGEPTNKGK